MILRFAVICPSIFLKNRVTLHASYNHLLYSHLSVNPTLHRDSVQSLLPDIYV